MPKILSRCQKALETQMIDMQISLNKHKSLMKKTFGISSTVGAMAALTSLAFASGNASVGDVATFGNQIGQALGNIYDTAFKVITAAAALALLIALVSAWPETRRKQHKLRTGLYVSSSAILV